MQMEPKFNPQVTDLPGLLAELENELQRGGFDDEKKALLVTALDIGFLFGTGIQYSRRDIKDYLEYPLGKGKIYMELRRRILYRS